MQQRQPRLGDILDDYCPRERRLTNHAVVALIGDEVKQTRCTTCEADHEYRHAKVPRQRKKSEQGGLYSQVLAAVTPKKVSPMALSPDDADHADHDVDLDAEQADVFDAPEETPLGSPAAVDAAAMVATATNGSGEAVEPSEDDVDEPQPENADSGFMHRRLIRAQLPRHEGQVSTTRQAPEFTIRQPSNARTNRFRARPPRSGSQPFGGGRSGNGNGNGNGNVMGNGGGRGGQRQGGRPAGGRPGNQRGPGRNRPK
jgi:hypothetical protein